MDLIKFEPRLEGERMHLKDPISGAKLFDEKSGEPVEILLVSRDSREYREATRRVTEKRLGLGRRPSFEELEGEAIDVLVCCTKGWDNITLRGEALPCTEGNARMLYTNFPFVKEQVDAFVGSRANFIQPS